MPAFDPERLAFPSRQFPEGCPERIGIETISVQDNNGELGCGATCESFAEQSKRDHSRSAPCSKNKEHRLANRSQI